MTRYEAWWVTPAFALYCWSKTQRVGRAILTLFIFLLVPGAWMMGNYLYTGHALLALQTVRHGASLVNAQKLDVLEALNFLGSMAVFHLGVILVVAMVGGVIWQLLLIARSANKPEQVLYIAVVCLYWLGMVYLPMNIRASLWNRFLLFGLVMSFPLAFLPFIGPSSHPRPTFSLVPC